MITSLELVPGLDDAGDEPALIALATAALANDAQAKAAGPVRAVRVRRRSLDARGAIRLRLLCDVYCGETPPEEDVLAPAYRAMGETARRVIIVGSGPAGLFAALRLIELGVRPIIVERGKDVRARRRDLALINRQGIVDPDSNYSFGEGGAGTYSDGKLYTRVKDKALIAQVLGTLVAHGAAPDILVDAHPHIGSNRLPLIVAALRATIEGAGGEFHFGERVVDFVLNNSGRLCGARTAAGTEFVGQALILAAGHSARELFEVLHRRGIELQPKPFAMGVRIEHPQPLIDAIQYRAAGAWRTPQTAVGGTSESNGIVSGEWRHPRLPPAAYRLAATIEERGVFSFCMCPGGWIVPAATAPGEVVVNGMSLSRRDSPYANSGLVVAVLQDDLAAFEQHGVLAGLAYQRQLEAQAAVAGGNAQRAPAQRATDYLKGTVSASLPACSYRPGLTPAPLHELLPPALARRLAGGLRAFGKTMRGYLSDEALLVGVESRTSAPLRIPRDPATLCHAHTPGLYPCGEGAGYAGGIVSAAIDGLRVAEACAVGLPASTV